MRQLFRELKRRKVYHVAVTYAVVVFVTLQAAELIFPATTLEGLYDTLVVLSFVGFPIALVLAWAFEVTPEGVRRTAEAEAPVDEPLSTEDRRSRSRWAMSALVGLGLVAAAVAGGWYLMGGGGGESPEVTEGTVAVLPFEVSGSGAEEWRDGMVSLLSTGLDGAGGLRAIADRTVLATWETNAGIEGRATTEEALSVARELGAEHAVIGSAAGLGDELQLTADVHGTRSGERLDRVEVRGSPDSVSALFHELTRQVIGVLAAETGERLRSAELASVLTGSVDALKLYLSGLQHERAMETEAAIEDYRAAIEADSTFALPYARIGFLGIWRHEAQGEALRRAHELSDRLPERERRLVQALHLGRIEHRTLAAADSLRQLTEDYPDDPSMWRTLGEFVLHDRIPNGWPEGEEAHRRAVELDPENPGHYPHYVRPSFALHHDSALATRRVEAMPAGDLKRLYRLGLEAVFGSSETREPALARYDTVSIPGPWMAVGPLLAPESVQLLDDVLRRLLEREDLDPIGAEAGGSYVTHLVAGGDYVTHLLINDLNGGQPDQFLRDLKRWETDGDLLACLLLRAAARGVSMPDSMTRRYLAPEELPADPSLQRLGCVAMNGMVQGQMEAVDRLLERLQAESNGEADLSPAHREAILQELEGFRAWKEGDLERAGRLLSRSNESGLWGALRRGDLYRELGELERAEGWYRVWPWPSSTVAYERLGGLYEEMDRPEDAAAAYRRFIAAWEDADEELQPRVEAARERVRELTGSGAEPDG
jgi:tetratricopeptide (TPR) repeat protein